jgi:hypothetical protein
LANAPARRRSIGAIALTGGSLSPVIAISPLAQADHAGGLSTPGAHAASAVIEKLTAKLIGSFAVDIDRSKPLRYDRSLANPQDNQCRSEGRYSDSKKLQRPTD